MRLPPLADISTMLLRTLAFALVAGCGASSAADPAAEPPRVADAQEAPRLPASEATAAVVDTVDADLTALPADLRQCVAASVREGGLRFEVVGEVEQGGTRYVLVEGFEPDDALGAFSFIPRLLRVEEERCENVLVIGSDAAEIADHVGSQYGDLIRQAALSEVERVGGAASFESLYRDAGWSRFRTCADGELSADTGCLEPAWAAGYRAAGVAVQ